MPTFRILIFSAKFQYGTRVDGGNQANILFLIQPIIHTILITKFKKGLIATIAIGLSLQVLQFQKHPRHGKIKQSW